MGRDVKRGDDNMKTRRVKRREEEVESAEKEGSESAERKGEK